MDGQNRMDAPAVETAGPVGEPAVHGAGVPPVGAQEIDEHWRRDLADANGDLLAAMAPPPPEEERRNGFEPMPPPGLHGLIMAIEQGPYDPVMAQRPAELAADCGESVIVTFDPRAARLPVRAVQRLDEAYRLGNPCIVIPHPQSDVDPEEVLLRIRPYHAEALLDAPVPCAAQRLPERLDLRRQAPSIEVREAEVPLPDADASFFVPEGHMARFWRRSGPEWLVVNLGVSDEGARRWAWTPLPAAGDGGVHGGECLWAWTCGDGAAARAALGRGDPDRDPWLYHAVAGGLRAVWRSARPRGPAHCSYHHLLPWEEWLEAEAPAWSFTTGLHFAGTDRNARTWELLDRPRLEARIRDWNRAPATETAMPTRS